MESKLLSIIVPVYNSEKYISKCIESILNQSYKNIELLLIDNMSEDSSRTICESYENADSRIRLLVEPKKGAAAVRNRGIREASGDYITFIDSDDYIAHESYGEIIKKMLDTDVELACFSYNCVDNYEKSLDWYEPRLDRYNKQKYTGKEVAKIFLRSLDIEGFCWNKVFKKQTIKPNRG